MVLPLSLLIQTDNHVDAATKSRTSEDILRSSRLSTYSPEPYSQSESDYYPYSSSPRGMKHHCFTYSECTDGTHGRAVRFVAILSCLSIYSRCCCAPRESAKFIKRISFISFPLPAYRVPRRRFSTGGDEETWSHGLQRVRASSFSLFSSTSH